MWSDTPEGVPFARPEHTDEEIALVASVIRSGHTAGDGPISRRVEQLLSNIHHGSPSLLTTSCTHALEMAALLLGPSKSHNVIVPSFAFVSVANAFALRGFQVRFADIEPDTLSLSARTVEPLVDEQTVAICVVNYGGAGRDLIGLRDLADSKKIFLIEDNAHGMGSSFEHGVLGTVGHFSTLSFHQTKNVSCGEGGALIINVPEFVERAQILREKGTDRSQFVRGQVDRYTWRDVGSSWIMAEVLAALLIPQLEHLSEIQAEREGIWSRYWNELIEWAEENEAGIPPHSDSLNNSAHVFYLLLKDASCRERFIQHMKNMGITVVSHYEPLHLSSYWLGLKNPQVSLPITESTASRICRLPIYRNMPNETLQRVVNAVLDFRSKS